MATDRRDGIMADRTQLDRDAERALSAFLSSGREWGMYGTADHINAAVRDAEAAREGSE